MPPRRLRRLRSRASLGLVAAIALTGGCGGDQNRLDTRPADVASPQDADHPEGAATVEYDLGGDFSISQNPNGPWSYGYSPSPTLAATPLSLDAYPVPMSPVAFWHPGSADSLYYPYVAVNETATTVADPTNSWAVRGHEVAMEGSSNGQYGIIQFTAPRRATYAVRADFSGIHFRLSSTDVHVFQGGVSLFDAPIDGYGGDPAFHAIEGANPTASYDGVRSLDAGDTLTFFVGIGANGTFYNDTTGLFVHITETD